MRHAVGNHGHITATTLKAQASRWAAVADGRDENKNSSFQLLMIIFKILSTFKAKQKTIIEKTKTKMVKII